MYGIITGDGGSFARSRVPKEVSLARSLIRSGRTESEVALESAVNLASQCASMLPWEPARGTIVTSADSPMRKVPDHGAACIG
jgi:hypothetical protein